MARNGFDRETGESQHEASLPEGLSSRLRVPYENSTSIQAAEVVYGNSSNRSKNLGTGFITGSKQGLYERRGTFWYGHFGDSESCV